MLTPKLLIKSNIFTHIAVISLYSKQKAILIMSNKINILIADDQSSIRDLLKDIISSLGENVVGEAVNGLEVVELYKKLQPDLTLLDINMPQMDGKQALRAIREEDPKAIVSMLTSQNTMDIVRQCMEFGAKNFILKTEPDAIKTELKKMIKILKK